MRLIVFFDLPVETAAQRKAYRQFRKHLIKEGFLMMQESVYSKLVINDRATESALARLRSHKPPSGLVQVLKVTEKQYTTIEYITGKSKSLSELDTTEEFLVI